MEIDNSNGILRLAVLLFCLLASAFFSASETSLLTIGKIRVRSLVDEGVKNAKILTHLIENTDKALSAILFGNNLLSILASVITTSLAIQYFGGNTGVALGIATGATTLVILIFCDITPKSMAVKNAERIAVIIAKPMYAVIIILKPVIYLLNKISSVFIKLLSGKPETAAPTYTENELKTMVTVSHEEGVLNVDEKEMIHNVFEFGDGEVREIMTPRIHVVSIDADADYKEVKDLFTEHNYSRIPVTKPGTDEVTGVLNIKDIAFVSDKEEAIFSIDGFLRPAHFVYEFNNIAKVFSEMRRERIGMSIVLDEYGVMVGVITNEDFVEQIVGDINDEYDDAEAPVAKIGENEYIVDGTMGLDDFCEAVGVKIESDDFDSIGGFVLGELDEFPAVGDAVRYEDTEFTIESVANNRIEKLHVKIYESTAGGAADEIVDSGEEPAGAEGAAGAGHAADGAANKPDGGDGDEARV